MSELVKIEESKEQALTKFDNFKNVQEQLEYAQLLIDSGFVKFKKPEQVIMVGNLGRALGISFEIASQSIESIQGKLTLSTNLMASLAASAGVGWEIVQDGEIIGEGKDKDMVTTIIFYRKNEKLNKVLTNKFSYTWSDATQAGYTSKDNWKRMPKNMLRVRCLAQGLRFVAPDVLTGLFYEQSELLDAKNIDFSIDDEGNVTVLD